MQQANKRLQNTRIRKFFLRHVKKLIVRLMMKTEDVARIAAVFQHEPSLIRSCSRKGTARKGKRKDNKNPPMFIRYKFLIRRIHKNYLFFYERTLFLYN